MNTKTIFFPAAAVIFVGVAGCVENRAADHPISTEYVRPDGKIYSPAAPPETPPAKSTPATNGEKFGIVDSIQVIRPHIADPSAIPSGPEMTPGNPLPASSQATREIAKERQQEREKYQVRVRLEDGNYRTVSQENLRGLKVGDRVRVGDDGVTPN